LLPATELNEGKRLKLYLKNSSEESRRRRRWRVS